MRAASQTTAVRVDPTAASNAMLVANLCKVNISNPIRYNKMGNVFRGSCGILRAVSSNCP
jgi:hypothetical protein